MRLIVPISVGRWGRLFSRWDVLAVLLIFGLLVFLAEASRHLFEPLTELQQQPTVARSAQSARICRAHHAAHADRHGGCRSFSPSPMRRWPPRTNAPSAPRPAARYPAIGADPRLHLGHGGVLHGAGARARAGRRIRRDLRDFHQPGLEHGVQLLSVAAHGADRAAGGVAQFPAVALDDFLAARSAVRHAAADLEHDDVDVGELVLRRRVRSDQRRQHDGDAARRRLLHRARHRKAGYARSDVGDRHHADRDPDLRPDPVPAAGGVGRPLPLRAGGRHGAAALLGVRRAAPVPHRRADDATARQAVAANVSPPDRQAEARGTAAALRSRQDRIPAARRDRHRARRHRAVAECALCGHRYHAIRYRHRDAVGTRHAHPRRRADRHRQRHLGADRGVGRHAPARGRNDPAGGAISRRLSGEPAVSDRRLGDRRLAARSEYLAFAR